MSPAPNGPASQEFRNGAATGIADLVARLVAMSSWGLTIDDRDIRRVAAGLTAEWGGADVNEASR